MNTGKLKYLKFFDYESLPGKFRKIQAEARLHEKKYFYKYIFNNFA